MPHCPHAHDLNRFLSREMPDGESHRVAEHIDHCGACQTALEKLSEQNDLLQWRVAAVGTCDRLPIGPSLAIVMESARHAAATPRWGVAETADDAAPAPLTFLGPPRRDGDLGSLGPYLVRAELGRGGMGIVLEAFDTELSRDVAIKVLRPDRADEKSRARFVREAQSAARVKHDHVVTIYSVANPPGALPYLVMELVRGPTLRALIDHGHASQSSDKSPPSKGRIDPPEVARIIAEVADGLAAAHVAGLVHRDVKPSNVLLNANSKSQTTTLKQSPSNKSQNTKPAESAGDLEFGISDLRLVCDLGFGTCDFSAKLSDFGLARLTSLPPGSTLTHDGTLVGTPTYMSPEQVRNPEVLDPRGDVYSLGVTMYEALTREAPFTGAPHEVLRQIESDEPRSPRRLDDAIPADLETICLKAMSKSADRRYPTAREFAHDLRRWLGGEPITARPVSRVERFARWCRRNPRVAALTGVVAALLGVVSVGSLIASARISREQQRTEQVRLVAIEAGDRATAAARIADERGELTLDTLNELIFKLQTQLADRQATLKVREDLLETALAGLGRVTNSDIASPAAAHSFAVAHLRIGDVLWQSGRSDEARGHFNKALEIAERQCEADPGDVEAWRDAASAHENLGNLAQQAFDLADAKTRYERSLAIRETLAAGNPERADIERELATSHMRLGNVIASAGDNASARAAYERATRIVQSLVDSQPEDRASQRDLVKGLYRLSWTESLLGDVAAAQQHADRGLALADAILAADPGNVVVRGDRVLLQQCLANISSASGSFDDAIARYRHALDDLEPLAAAEPDNAERQWRLQFVYHQIAGIQRTRNDITGATVSAEQKVRILDPLVTQNPSSPKYRNCLIETVWELSEYALRRGDFDDARSKYARIDAMLEHAEQSGTMQPELEPYKLLGGKLLAAVALVPRAVDDFDFARSQDAAIRPMLFALVAYEFARRGEHASAARVAEKLRDDLPDVTGIERGVYFLFLARTYSLCLAATNSRGAALPDDAAAPDDSAAANAAALRSRYLRHAIDCLREASLAFPFFISGYNTEPDLTAVRATPEFAALLGELQPAK